MAETSEDKPAAGSGDSRATGSYRHRWLYDWTSPWEYAAHAVRWELAHLRSAFQDIEIIETEQYGRCLVLDGEVQSYEADEHIYHESLVHPAMVLHQGPRRVLVIGGGEGATLREVLRHRSVEQAIMVDLDPDIVAVAREYLPSFHAGAFDDPRVQLEFGDGRAFVERSESRFDVVVIDVNNPLEDGPAFRLFTHEFYSAVRERLTRDGLVALQSGAATTSGLPGVATIHQTLRTVFRQVFTCVAFIPAFTIIWSFTLAGEHLQPPLQVAAEEIDRRLSSRLNSQTRFYDGTAHHRVFRLPRYLRDALLAKRPISRDQQPWRERHPGLVS